MLVVGNIKYVYTVYASSRKHQIRRRTFKLLQVPDVALLFLFSFHFICHYLIIILFYKLQELIKEIEINVEET